MINNILQEVEYLINNILQEGEYLFWEKLIKKIQISLTQQWN